MISLSLMMRLISSIMSELTHTESELVATGLMDPAKDLGETMRILSFLINESLR